MKTLRFAFRMARRGMRRSERRFAFFLLSIAIGVSGLVGVKGFNANLQQALLDEARTLMAADLKVSTTEPATKEQEKVLDELRSQGVQITHNVELASMAFNPENMESALVEVKAVGPSYPFYGIVAIDREAELTDDSAVVGQELLDRLGLEVGDSFRVGSGTFNIAAVLVKEPDRVTAGIGLGPRVMITEGGLDHAKLIKPGSPAGHSYLVKLNSDDQVESIRQQLADAFADQRPTISDFREAQPQIRDLLDRMTSFLSLISMVALLVGGLGVASTTQVFVQRKLDTIAIMKVLGGTNRKVTITFLTQILLLSLTGSLLGVLLGYIIQLVMPMLVSSMLDLPINVHLNPVIALQGLVVGLVTAILFTMMPLAAISDVKPALVFRRDLAESRTRPTWRQRLRSAFLLLITLIGLALISSWVSESLTWGFSFTIGLVLAVLLLGAASSVVVWLVRQIRLPRSWVSARQGLANLHRPGSQATSVILALGVGVTLVFSVYLVQQGLSHEVRLTSPEGAPNTVFLGLEEADAEPFAELIRSLPGVEDAPNPIPVVEGRFLTIDGKGKDQLTLSAQDENLFDLSTSLTFSETIPSGHEVIQGEWWTDTPSEPLVSVDSEFAARLGIEVGSTLELKLEGDATVTAKVANLRQVKEIGSSPGLNLVFSPDALEGAPVTYLGQARIQPDAASAVQKEIVSRFPGVAVINVNDLLETVGDILNRIGLIINIMAAFSVVAGLIILASSIMATKFRRIRETVLFKTLGATRRKVTRMFAVEYAVLGLVAGAIGVGLASAAAWAIMKFAMDLKFTPPAVPSTIALAITIVLTVTVGVLSTLDVLATKPLEVLREE